MKIKLISLFAILMCAATCLFSLTSCDIMDYVDDLADEIDTSVLDATVVVTDIYADANETADATETEEATEKETDAGVNEEQWAQMISEVSFENYTLNIDGVMTVTYNGQAGETSTVKQCIKVTSDKVSMYSDPQNSEAGDGEPLNLVFDGEIAEAQKLQFAQVFMAMLSDFSNFKYDVETNTYIIPETVVIEKVLKGIAILEDDVQLFDAPTKIEMREAEVTISEDGKLLKLVCDYTQTIEVNGSTSSNAGLTTWTFSDYGTTVIE